MKIVISTLMTALLVSSPALPSECLNVRLGDSLFGFQKAAIDNIAPTGVPDIAAWVSILRSSLVKTHKHLRYAIIWEHNPKRTEANCVHATDRLHNNEKLIACAVPLPNTRLDLSLSFERGVGKNLEHELRELTGYALSEVLCVPTIVDEQSGFHR